MSEKNIVCPKCGSTRVAVQVVEKQKKRGCIASVLWIIFAICTCGLVLLVPLLIKKGSKTMTFAVCQDCGNRWKV